ncbi:hypothetical protein NXW27_13005 [Phocaeicola dorei]|nr:hypothetical protein [Phocaeicola dorei]
MKKKIYTLSVLLAAVLPAGAQSIKSDINTVLNDIALPIFLGVMVMALAVGIGKNWRLINDENSEGNKKQGWMNVAYMVGYVLIAVTVISFCVGKIAKCQLLNLTAMEYKVRKGIENPCKIHGLLVRDFYLLLGYGGFAVAVLLLNVKSWLEDGTTGGEMLFIFVLLVGCGLLLARKFYKNASRKKYRPPHWEKTVTNRDVRNALMKKQINY